jgi:hypothetical protein
MDIMEKLNFFAHTRAEIIEKSRNDATVRSGVPITTLTEIPFHAVRRPPRNCHLTSYKAISTCCELADLLLYLLEIASSSVRVKGKGNATPTAEELIERHSCSFSLDVPQCHVHAGKRVVEHRAIAPVRAEVCCLPDILNIVDTPSNEKRLEIPFHSGHYREWSLGERCATEAVEAWLRGLHFDDDKPYPFGSSADRSHFADTHYWLAARLPRR